VHNGIAAVAHSALAAAFLALHPYHPWYCSWPTATLKQVSFAGEVMMAVSFAGEEMAVTTQS
jgi:hypothetical protein